MGFALLKPAHKVKTGKLIISCNNQRGGPFRLLISMPHFVFNGALGEAEAVDLHWGNGADEGKLLITAPDGGGHFKPTFLKHAVIIRLPPSEDTPDFKMEPIDPEHRRTKDGLLIDLPEWAWSKERQKAIKLARQQVQREKVVK